MCYLKCCILTYFSTNVRRHLKDAGGALHCIIMEGIPSISFVNQLFTFSYSKRNLNLRFQNHFCLDSSFDIIDQTGIVNIIILVNFPLTHLIETLPRSDPFCLAYVGTRKQTTGTARSHDMFCVCVAHCTPRRRNKERKRQPRRRRRRRRGRRRRRRKRRRSRREKRKERQRPVVVPWRAIYRTPNFFPSFFIPASRAPWPLRLSFAFYLRRESCRVRALHLPSCLSSFFCTDRPPKVPSPPRNPSSFSPGSRPPPPLHVRVPGHSFVESFRSSFRCRSSWRGGGAAFARYSAQMEEEKLRARRNYGERKVVWLMKSQFSVLPFADSAAGPIGLEKRLRGKNVYRCPKRDATEFIPDTCR